MNVGFYAGCDNRVYTTSTLHKAPLGGIQTSIVLLSRELAKYHDVYVFNAIDTPCDFVTEGGVTYVNHNNLGDYAPVLDAVISLSHEGLAMDSRIAGVPKKIFWKHHNEPFIDDEHMQQFIDTVDVVVFGSNFSRDSYSRHYESDKYEVIYLNIDIESAAPLNRSRRQPHMVYISCPNRGLRRFSKILPRIAAAIPEMELHSYGTFQIYGSTWRKSDDEYRDEPEYVELVGMDNFFQHDSVPYYELMKILSESLIFTYPCVFLESFCAAAGMAMACGLPMVTTHVGALRTLYPDYRYAIDVPDSDLGKVHTDWYADLFTEHVVKLYNDSDEWSIASAEAIELAARYDVKKIAKEWVRIIES